MEYDAFMLVSFGGPESKDQVSDFLKRITRGKKISPERLEEITQRYLQRGGFSPLNENNRQLLSRLSEVFKAKGLDMELYLGNRNSPPFIADALHQMQKDGKQNAIALISSPFASYSSCRQYLENIEEARQELAATQSLPVPEVQRLRHFYNHPAFIQIHSENIKESLSSLSQYSNPHILFSAHSLPLSMAENCEYSRQIYESCRLIIETLTIETLTIETPIIETPGKNLNWSLAYQSISGPPQNWLGPDILQEIKKIKQDGADAVLVCPVGFLSDHMEVIFDLDTDAKNAAEKAGLGWARSKTPQQNPEFAQMILELLLERTGSDNKTTRQTTRQAIGKYKAPGDFCPPECCLKSTAESAKS